jgi:hypothetical protein
MSYRSSTGAFALAAALMVTLGGVTVGSAQAADAKYPNWKGQWDSINPRLGGQGVKFDPNKAFGPAQQAPLTPEYQKVHEESMADQALGGQGNFIDHAKCYPGGMPSMMSAPNQEYIITPETTYISVNTDLRRIFTDGRPWPTDLDPTYQGYSIGKWIDEDGDGVYDVLEARPAGRSRDLAPTTRPGCRCTSTIESTFKERFHLDKNDPNLLHEEITVFDHALTRPWSVDKTYRRDPNPYPNWTRVSCAEGTNYVVIGNDVYFMSGDGYLMPTKKGQAPPDARYFKQTQKTANPATENTAAK